LAVAGKTVVVTGAGGFVGSHLTETLVSKGAHVRAFLHYRSTTDRRMLEFLPTEVLAEVETIFGDLRDADTVRRIISGASLVFHLGALVGIPYSYRSPRDVIETNVLGTLNVLEAVRELEVERLVHTSSSEVYGTAQYVPIDENHPLRGQSPYAASKIAADQIVESFGRSFGLRVATVRPFNAYGPRQSSRAIVPTVITQLLTGDTVRVGSTSPTRDLNFVRDLIDAFIAVGESVLPACSVLNVGTGFETSIADLIATIGDLLEKDPRIETDPQRVRPASSEVDRLVADSTRLREAVAWAPRLTLRHGLQETIDWIRENIELYRPDEYAV
jgi:NAD dependent epimerase/dehydratase